MLMAWIYSQKQSSHQLGLLETTISGLRLNGLRKGGFGRSLYRAQD